MSDLRRALLTMVALAVLCTVVGVFLFPGPSDHRHSPASSLPSIDNLGSVTPAPPQAPTAARPVATPTRGTPSASPAHGGNADRPLTRNVPTTTTTTTTLAPPPATTTTTAPPPANSSNCGGGVPDVAVNPTTGQPWKCTFDDEFNGTTLDTSKWFVQESSASGFHSGVECYMNSPNNVSVSGGVLSLTARAEPAPFLCNGPGYTQYTSGMVSTYQRFSQTYGLFEVRAKFPSAAVPGLQTTLWLWPVNSKFYGPLWPQSGEIDFAEWFSQFANLDIPTIHYLKALGTTNPDTAHCPLPTPDSFHTFGVVWTPTTMTILLDGATCLVDSWVPALPLNKPAPFDQPFILLLTQALGIDTNAFNAGTTPLPATTQIDWVRVWG